MYIYIYIYIFVYVNFIYLHHCREISLVCATDCTFPNFLVPGMMFTKIKCDLHAVIISVKCRPSCTSGSFFKVFFYFQEHFYFGYTHYSYSAATARELNWFLIKFTE